MFYIQIAYNASRFNTEEKRIHPVLPSMNWSGWRMLEILNCQPNDLVLVRPMYTQPTVEKKI